MGDLKRFSKCGRCGGSGMHTHGVCYGCSGLGIPVMTDYLPYKKNVDAVVSELGKAEILIHAMLSAMTLEQKTMVAAQLGASGISQDEMTRANERRAALASFDQ